MTDHGPHSLAAAQAAAAHTGRLATAAAAAHTAAIDRLQQRIDALRDSPGDPTAADLDAYLDTAAAAAERLGDTAQAIAVHMAAVLSVRIRTHGPPAHLVAHADQMAAAQADAAAALDDAVDRWRAADDDA